MCVCANFDVLVQGCIFLLLKGQLSFRVYLQLATCSTLLVVLVSS